MRLAINLEIPRSDNDLYKVAKTYIHRDLPYHAALARDHSRDHAMLNEVGLQLVYLWQ